MSRFSKTSVITTGTYFSKGLTKQFKDLIRQKDYMFLLISSGFILGTSYSFPVILEQLVRPYGYTSKEASVYGVMYNLTGIIGSILITFILIKFRIFRVMTMFLICTIAALFLGLKFSLQEHDSHKWTYALVSLNGFFSVAAFSVIYEQAMCLTPGFSEAMSGGLINMLFNLFGFLQILVYQSITEKLTDGKEYINVSLYIIEFSALTAFVLYCFVRESKT
jgi:cyanate permease